ncbi:hypothetical protein KAR91_07645 [Candidatus Pacearchaeota archaeon]|nr:hypothetical protein [Candidatus Pacearchaeota archaeon]
MPYRMTVDMEELELVESFCESQHIHHESGMAGICNDETFFQVDFDTQTDINRVFSLLHASWIRNGKGL